MKKGLLISLSICSVMLFTRCGSGNSESYDPRIDYSDAQYESDFEALDALKAKILSASAQASEVTSEPFINSDLIRKLSKDTLHCIFLDKFTLNSAESNRGIMKDGFTMDAASLTILMMNGQVDSLTKNRVNKSYLRHYACDKSKMALFERDLKFDYDFFNDHSSSIEKLTEPSDIYLLILDNFEIELPELDEDETSSTFYPGFIRASVTAIDLNSKEILFKLNTMAENSSEIEYMSYSTMTNPIEARMELVDNLFENLMPAVETTIESVFRSEALSKKVKFVFRLN